MSIRTRTRDGFAAFKSFEFDRNRTCSDTAWKLQATFRDSAVGTYESMLDTVIPNFQRRRAAGEVFFNPMKYEKTVSDHVVNQGYVIKYVVSKACTAPELYREHKSEGPFWTYNIPGVDVDGRRYAFPLKIISESDVQSLVRQVSTEVLAKRGRGDTNSWETLAELQKTLGMFSAPMGKLTRWLNTVAKASYRGTGRREVAKTASDLWLTYRYGIRPIVADIENLLKVLRNTALRHRVTTRSAGRLQATGLQGADFNFGVIGMHWDASSEHVVTVRGMSLDEVDLSLIDDLGFSAKGLLTLPWELVPASFVLDWMLNVGDFLNAIAPAVGWNSLGSCVSIQHSVKTTYVVSYKSMVGTSYTCLQAPSGVSSVVYTSKERQALTSPGIVVKSDFRFDKGTRVADALTLAASRFSNLFIGRNVK